MARRDLAEITTFEELVRYLRDELDWPIQEDSFEESSFDYNPEEIGLDPATAAKVRTIKQLRPLTASQPWGVFFIEFEPKRLPVIALRRILSGLAVKKRASANPSDRVQWNTDDLVFISSFGEVAERQLGFAHFSAHERTTDLPTLKVLGWDARDTTLHVRSVAAALADHLTWPADDSDADAWRRQWRSAFTLRHREVVATAQELSAQLAVLARSIRARINTALSIESNTGPLTQLMSAFRDALVHELDADGFADMYAQTIAYGLLSARVTNPAGDTADDLALAMPLSNPFLRELMEAFLRAGGRQGSANQGGIDFDELGVNEVVDLLDAANIEAVLRDFGDRNPLEDPVIHFYERFLNEYDASIQMKRGVFFTPTPVVSYIVRSVDRLLREKFGLDDGLADTTTWAELKHRIPAVEIPPGVDPDSEFVRILDPATGTGTFLVEVIEVIHQTMTVKWNNAGRQREIPALWNQYVANSLLPRLHGFELLMAPYAIAHLKIGLKLHETGYLFEADERVRIYLTNALDPVRDYSDRLEAIVPALAHEAQAVNSVKATPGFTVVLGNPPYANYSANLSPELRAGVDKYRRFDGEAIRERNQLQFERNLQDDFVKFVALAEDAIFRTGTGVLGFITNATMLASLSLRGMRQHLRTTFPELRGFHLHGGTNEQSPDGDDKNVFDIVQAVAIHLYARVPSSPSVGFAEIWGPRSSKYDFLLTHDAGNMPWLVVEPDEENCAFVPQDTSSSLRYARLDDVFAQFGGGIKTNRDAIAIGFSVAEVLDSVESFAPRLARRPGSELLVQDLLYRPFDERKIFYHEDVVASRSLPTLRHVLAGANLSLIASSTWTTPQLFSVGASRHLVEMKTGTHDRGTTVFPLYRFESILDSDSERVSNIRASFLTLWESSTGWSLTSPAAGGDYAEQLFGWIFAICHSEEYRTRFRAQVSQGFALVLFPREPTLFSALSAIGHQIAGLQMLESEDGAWAGAAFDGPDEPLVSKIGWSQDTVWLDAAATSARAGQRATAPGTTGFVGIPEAVWDTHVGGYQVCHKWLKDRRGRRLSAEEIIHYVKIVSALSLIGDLVPQIDAVIAEHGGWPDAFVSK